MKSNELRVGNWVEVLGYVQIKNGNDIDIIVRGGEDGANGIPITTDILEKAGFKFTKLSGIGGQDQWSGLDLWEASINGVTIEFRGNKNGKLLILVGYFNTQIESVHRLQNVIYTLTGEELNIKF